MTFNQWEMAADQKMWTLIEYIMNNKFEIMNIIDELKPMIVAAIIIGTICIILCIAILWNQRKIKRQLRQLLEQKEVTSSGEGNHGDQ